MSSIFTQIINGNVPAYTLYEDEYVLAFLDIFPQAPGHTLIVPKIEVDHFSDVPEPYYYAIFQAAQKLAPAIKAATGCNRVCAAFIGYQIPHCHFQLLPTFSEADFVWKPVFEATPEDLKTMQEKILLNI
ncbi:MAG: HIT family protein [Candidatus Altimarinota bacterium]